MAERRPLYDTGAGLKEFDPASGDTLAGAGAGGSSGINYVTNPDFEVDASGWAAYADAAGASPVDGTGGSPVVTITRSTTTPLRKTASGLITKDAANRQGNGVSYDFTIDSAQKGRALSVLFDYIVGSGTFAAGDASSDGDITVYIYDVTNARLIPMSDRKLYSNSATLSSKFIGLFQASPDSTSYRLIIHCGSTSASAYTLRFDEVQVSPLASFPSAVVTDWQAYTPTIQGGGTLTNVNVLWRRVGDVIEIRGRLTLGTVSSSEFQLSLPIGVISSLLTQNPQIVGRLVDDSAAASTIKAFNLLATGGDAFLNLSVFGDYALGNSNLTEITTDSALGNSQPISFYASVPIAGWGSAITSALNGDDGRVIVSQYSIPAATAFTAATQINFSTKVEDTHNAVTTGASWKFVAPIASWYEASIENFATTSGTKYIELYKNGAQLSPRRLFMSASSADYSGGTTKVYLKAGEYIDIRSHADGTTDQAVTITINRIAGNAVAVGFVGQATPVGTYIQHAGATAPTGFLACDGAAISRATYAALFAVISTTYGVGDGSTTFNLPDARGLVMVGAGSHGTMTRADASAFNGGTVGATRNDQMQGHWHEAWGSASNTGSGVFSTNDRPSPVTTLVDASTVQDPTTDGTNGTPRTGNETRPAEIAVLVCIKH